METADKLEKVKTNLLKMGAASKELEASLSRIKVLIPADFYARPAEEQTYNALDSLKLQFAGADIAVTNIEDKGDVLILPVNITGQLKDYTVFVNNTGYLTTLKFPFFSINSISLSKKQEKDKSAVVYTISGTLEMPKR